MKKQTNTSYLHDLDFKHLIHPWVNWEKETQNKGMIIKSAKGAYIQDIEDNRYLDTTGGLWSVNIGYGREEMARAIYQQINKLNHFPIFGNVSNEPSIQLAAKLAHLAPSSINKVFFTTTGSSANDSAVRIAHHYHVMRGNKNKKHIITRDCGYHGMSFLGASLSGQPAVYDGAFVYERELVHRVSAPYVYRKPEEMSESEWKESLVDEFRTKVEEIGPENIACFICEPVVGAGGVLVPPREYMKDIYAICHKYDILTIADEVITAFGRTGYMYASSELFSVTPDITCLAKGITSGYQPLGAVLIADRVYDAIAESNSHYPFAHGFTYTGHSVACAAAIENISILEHERIPEHVKLLAPYFLEQMKTLLSEPLVGDVRGIGFMIAIEFVQNKLSKTPFPESAMLKDKFRKDALKRGLFTRPLNNCALISPPLIISKNDIDIMVEGLRLCCRSIASQLISDGFSVD